MSIKFYFIAPFLKSFLVSIYCFVLLAFRVFYSEKHYFQSSICEKYFPRGCVDCVPKQQQTRCSIDVSKLVINDLGWKGVWKSAKHCSAWRIDLTQKGKTKKIYKMLKVNIFYDYNFENHWWKLYLGIPALIWLSDLGRHLLAVKI